VPLSTKATPSLPLNSNQGKKREKKRISRDSNKIYVRKEKKSSTWWYPSQDTKGLTQTDKTGVLIPIKL
jgi:hypothetical protein